MQRTSRAFWLRAPGEGEIRSNLAAGGSAAKTELSESEREICAALGPVLDRLTCPVRYVLATGANLGGGGEEMEQMRASLDPVLARNQNLRVSAKVASNHTQILRKDFRAVADAVREVAEQDAR